MTIHFLDILEKKNQVFFSHKNASISKIYEYFKKTFKMSRSMFLKHTIQIWKLDSRKSTLAAR